jgi:MarR family transcriptional regulator, temperature-dependent positive regulator of motility
MTYEISDYPGHLIRRLHQSNVAAFDAAMRSAGTDLTPVQFAALQAIQSFPRIDQTGLAREIAYDRVTTGGVVDRLESKGLVKRVGNPRDRRTWLLELTTMGAAQLDLVLPVIRKLEEGILSALEPDERALCLAILKKLVRATDAEKNNARAKAAA